MGGRVTRMDRASPAQWAVVDRASAKLDAGLADRVLALIRMLHGMDDGFGIDRLDHALQTATRAERADLDAEVVVAALVHDVGKIAVDEGHQVVSAEILRPYVRDDVYRVVLHHEDFTARYTAEVYGEDADLRERWRAEPWFDLAEAFVDRCDQLSFDPDYPTEPLDHFEPLVRETFHVDRAPTSAFQRAKSNARLAYRTVRHRLS